MAKLIDPADAGWTCIGPRTWKLPDGTEYVFPPGMAEVLVEEITDAAEEGELKKG